MSSQRTVLICPLDWGLGHASRCIPLINKILLEGNQVIIGTSGAPFYLLQQEFPQLEFIPLAGYNVKYPANGSMVVQMIRQLPSLLRSIYREHQWLKDLVKKRKIDQVISDNRYGLWHKSVHSVFITHQLFIRVPFGSVWINAINHLFIRRYDECWVPDLPGEGNLSGALSHSDRPLPHKRISYIGWLSRFSAGELQKATEFDPPEVLVLLSGPEPQRSLLEERILAVLETYSHSVLVVCGKPGGNIASYGNKHIRLVPHLPTEALRNMITQTPVILCRSGYSTLMDLAVLGRKAIVIPTPGQTEQEYLADFGVAQNRHVCIKQDELSEATLLPLIRQFQIQPPSKVSRL